MTARRVQLPLALSLPVAAQASWHPANATVAAVLATTERMDAAILAHDAAAFDAVFAADAEVNNPFNVIADKAMAIRQATVLESK